MHTLYITELLIPQDARRASLFRAAVARHVQYSAWAADGQGVDRHFFGLKKMVREGEQVPEIYKDESFSKSSHWELSTSQLSSPYLDGWGYGEGAFFILLSVYCLRVLMSSSRSCTRWLWSVVRYRRRLHSMDDHQPEGRCERSEALYCGGC